MRFRTKIFLLFLFLTVLSSSLLVTLIYWPVQRLFMDLMRTNVLSVAATTASMLDVENHEKIQTRADEDSAAYEVVERQLRNARDANRRGDFYAEFLYTMRPYSKDPKSAQFVVDTEEDGLNKSNVGDIYKPGTPNYLLHLNEYQTTPDFIHDQWGTWLSASAPIRDPASGETVGAVGVDMRASEAIARLHGLLWNCAIAFGISTLAAYGISILLAGRVAKPLATIRDGVERIINGNYSQAVRVGTKDEFGEVASAINKMATGLQQREEFENALTRYISADVITDVIYAGKASHLFSQRKKVTILFADMRGFTQFSEQVSPEETVWLLNDYFEQMVDAIFKNNGHLNKFMGDGLMAIFGALHEDSFQEERAVQAALDMREALQTLQQKWSGIKDRAHIALSDFRIGIGINTGLAIVGNIGSTKRMEFTAIGDAVNLAARLERATCDYPDVDILVSEYTFVAVRSRFPFELVGALSIKGKKEDVRTYTVPPASMTQ